MNATIAIAVRSLKLIPRVPSTFVPSLVMPIFFTVAFAGSMSGTTRLPGHPAAKAIDWFLPMAAMMGGGFAGMTTGLGVARDLENGFYERFLVSPISRASLLAGSIAAGTLRSFIPLTLMVIVGLIGGANFTDGPMAVVSMGAAVMGFALVSSGWAVAIALRIKTQQAAPLMSTAIFLSTFLSTAQMPLDLLSGWIKTVARYNPVSQVLALSRQGFLGDVTWAGSRPGLMAIAGLFFLTLTFAVSSMRAIGRQ